MTNDDDEYFAIPEGGDLTDNEDAIFFTFIRTVVIPTGRQNPIGDFSERQLQDNMDRSDFAFVCWDNSGSSWRWVFDGVAVMPIKGFSLFLGMRPPPPRAGLLSVWCADQGEAATIFKRYYKHEPDALEYVEYALGYRKKN